MITGKKFIIAGIAGRVSSGTGEHFLENGNAVWGYDCFTDRLLVNVGIPRGSHVAGDFIKGEFD